MMTSREDTDTRRATSINDLPHEILVYILSFVPLTERLNCALTCRSLAQALGARELTKDIRFNIVGIDEAKTKDALRWSCRQYRNLRLSEARMSALDITLWEKIGRGLRHLEFIECMWSPVIFYTILQECSNLESIKICGEVRMSDWNFALPAGFSLERIKESTRNVRHLHVGFPTNAVMFSALLAALPDTLTIALTRFDRDSDFLERLPDLLGTSRKITRLDLDTGTFTTRHIYIEHAVQLLRTCEASVVDIRSENATFFTPALFEMIEDCTKLRRLKFKAHQPSILNRLTIMPQNNPELETLELGSIASATQYFDVFAGCKKLRKLSLGTCAQSGFSSSELSPFLRRFESMPTLEELSFRFCNFYFDDTVLQSMASLSNLQSLMLDSFVWGAESFKLLFAGLEDLRKLTISGYPRFCHHGVTRMSFTGRCGNSFEHLILNFSGDRCKSSRLSSLKSLEIGCTIISDAGLTSIPSYHGHLREFTLINCCGVTDAGLEIFLRGEPQLEKLELHLLEAPKGTFLETLEKLCPRLRVLKLSCCREISRSIAQRFKIRRPTVKVHFDDGFIVPQGLVFFRR